MFIDRNFMYAHDNFIHSGKTAKRYVNRWAYISGMVRIFVMMYTGKVYYINLKDY